VEIVASSDGVETPRLVFLCKRKKYNGRRVASDCASPNSFLVVIQEKRETTPISKAFMATTEKDRRRKG